MEPIWLKSYQPGVPSTINPDAYPNLNALFAEAFAKYKELPALTNMDQVLTYAQVDAQAKDFAAFLQNTLQLPKGERVALMMPDIMQYPIAMLGILRAGCTVVNVNPLYTHDEFIVQLRDSQASTIVVLENFAHIVSDSIAETSIKHIIVAKISDVFPPHKAWLVDVVVRYIKRMVPAWKFDKFYWYKDAIAAGQQTVFKPVAIGSDDVAFLQYTGGTTGPPKGAMLTHRNMVANVLQASAWMSKLLVPRKEIIITALPLYHIFSLTANCLTFIYYGALNVLITDPRDKKTFLKQLKKHKFTAITGVNTLFNLLLNIPGFASVDFSHLKVALGGGMPVQKVVADRWQEVTKRPLLEAYGLSETSPAVCINPMNLKSYNGTVGLPVPSTDISIRDDHGAEVGLDVPGELFVRGPQVMRGYWRQEDETKLVLSADGWLNTGDIATINAGGFISIVDRKKDLIMVSGFKVYPNEVENVLSSMPGIKEVAVVAAPDEVAGEMVKAFIVSSDPSLDRDKVRAYCKLHLTGYKIPKVVEFRDSLPKSNVGKILRRALK
ncbi:MAG TPA: AMP-binding protein [Gammaproteobacteria bacterium]|nr:AMP-binding protein [Gammaproteobacteria bacterium]